MVHWYLTDPAEAFDFATTPITGDITLNAHWESATTYTITFNSNGGSAVSDRVGVVENTFAGEPTPPTRENYTFVHWYLTDPATAFGFTTTAITGNITLNAHWEGIVTTYNVTFETYGGSAVAMQPVESGQKATRPENKPTRAHFDFVDWFTAEIGGSIFDFGTPIVTHTTVHARWTPTMYNVTFNTYGGSAIATQPIQSGQKVTRPENNPTKSNSNFVDWFTAENGGSLFNFDTPIATHTTVHAQWTAAAAGFTVTFDVVGGTSSVAPIPGVASGKTITEPNAPTPPSVAGIPMHFIGWFEAGAASSFNFDTPITANLTLRARWSATSVVRVIFNSAGGSLIDVQSGIAPNGLAVRPAPNPVKGGEYFVDWFASTSDELPFDFATPIATSRTLTARWATTRFNVTFNSDGGSPVEIVRDIPNGQVIQAPTPPTKLGNTFQGWFYTTVLYDFATMPIKTDITLTAKWQELPRSTVTFDSDGGDPVNPIANILNGATITAPTSPAKENFHFTGWFLEGATEPFNFSTPITESITLKARWNENLRYTVTFASEGGSLVPAIQNVNPGSTITAPADPTRAFSPTVGLWVGDVAEITSYTFDGWRLQGAGGNFTFDTPINANITLIAQWTGPQQVGGVSGNILSAVAMYVNANPGTFTMVTDAVNQNSGQVSIGAGVHLHIMGLGSRRMITNDTGNGLIVASGANRSLTLHNNITLQGRTGNDAALVTLDGGAQMTMNHGAYIANNSLTDGLTNTAAGVNVNGAGTRLTMNGDSRIFGNNTVTTSGLTANGVRVSAGIFVMNGGIIEGSAATNRNYHKGGVWVVNGGTFEMNNNATVRNINVTSNNLVYGMVEVEGTGSSFTMNNGTISNADTSSINWMGAGVRAINGASFTMNGGSIENRTGYGVAMSGNNSSFTMRGGEIRGVSRSGIYNVTTNATITLHGGLIRNNTEHGVQTNGAFTMHGGTISSNGQHGVLLEGSSASILYGGDIFSNTGAGVNLSAAGRQLDIVTGTINGNTGANSNGGGAFTGLGTVRRGSLTGGLFTFIAEIAVPENRTVKVVNGQLQ